MTTQPFTLVSVGHDSIEDALSDELTGEESDAFLHFLNCQSWIRFDYEDQLHHIICGYYEDFKALKAQKAQTKT